jgi:hypothetical protein
LSAALALAPGKWMLRVEAVAADGTLFASGWTSFVKGLKP